MATKLVRIGVPGAMATVGLALVVFGGEFARAAGVVLLGGAVLVALSAFLIRLGLSSTEDREREEDARRYFTRHGRWPSGPS
jgi:hypothetical protein